MAKPMPDVDASRVDALLALVEAGLSKIERQLDKGLRNVARLSLIRSVYGRLGGFAAGRSMSREQRTERARKGGRMVFYGTSDADGADIGAAESYGKLLRQRRTIKGEAFRAARRAKHRRPSNVVDLPRPR